MPMKNIVLIGMPGAGKSTVGVILAKTLGMTFVDTDIAIQERAGLAPAGDHRLGRAGRVPRDRGRDRPVHSLPQFRHRHRGQRGFFEKSDGSPEEGQGVVVYLEISCEEMIRRLKNITTRGIVACCGPESFRYVLRKGPAVREVRRYHGRLRRGGFRGSRGEGDRGDCRGFLEDASTGDFASQPAQPCRMEFYKKMCFCRKPVFKLVQPPLRATCPPNGRGAHAMLLYYLCRGAYLSTRNTEHCRNRGMPQACGREGKKSRRPKRAIIQSVHGFLQSKKMEMRTGMEAEDLFLGAH